jgi:hypothetical protein
MSSHKERYQKRVDNIINIIIPILLENTEDDGRCFVSISTLREHAKETSYALNEALGQLKAIAFISERKSLKGRYYYNVDINRHPDKVPIDEKNIVLAERAERLKNIRDYQSALTKKLFGSMSGNPYEYYTRPKSKSKFKSKNKSKPQKKSKSKKKR